MKSELILENSVPLIEGAVEFVRLFSIKSGLPKDEADRFALCADEVITDVVRFAFPPGERGRFVVILESTPLEVSLTLRELGEPFDPDSHPYDPERARREGKFEGAGIELVKHLCDGFIFLNKGRAGKEFRLVKRIPSQHITSLFSQKELLKEPPETTAYCIAPVRPEDAEDISRLIYRTYRYTYPKEELYYPKRVREFIERGQKFGVIVRTKEGEAVGYFAVIVKEDSRIGEVGEAVVSPGHRGKGIMKMMMDSLIGMAREKGLLGLFGEAVTVHTISQKVNEKFGFKSTALMLGAFPQSRIVGIEEKYGQRVSVVIDFLHLKKRKKAKLYLPRKYRKLLKEIYQTMGIEVEEGQKSRKSFKSSQIELKVNFQLKVATIVVRRIGEDFKERLQRKVKNCNHLTK